MKHLLRQAVENGYTAIGWTTAEQQVGRWSREYEEGYRIEYDQNIPKFMRKYTKQWGGKVEGLNLENGEEVWGVMITPEMRESVLYEGQPLYSLAETYDEYEDAYYGDDEEWMRELVDEAARLNGYTKKAYHGTMKYGFNEFWEISRRELGVHFGTKAAADVFYDRAVNDTEGSTPGIYEVFLKMENTLRTPDVWGTHNSLKNLVNDLDNWIRYGYQNNDISPWSKKDLRALKEALVMNEDYTKYLIAAQQADNAFAEFKRNEATSYELAEARRNANKAAQTYLKNLGYDSVRYINEMEDAGNESYIILKPENIKSAETVTYDEDGNHVPLSERFDDSTRDIRYSIVHDVVDVDGNVYDDVVRLAYPANAEIYDDRGKFYTYALNNLAGQTVGFVDKYGRKEEITFAKADDFASKHNNSHAVLKELSNGKLSGPVSRVVYLNAPEALEVAQFSGHHMQDPDRYENHGWMDKYGWDWYEGYLLDRDNKLMPFTLHVARTSSGRNLLYTAYVGTKKAVEIRLGDTAPNNHTANNNIPQTATKRNGQNSGADSYSLVPVEPVQPSSNAWNRTADTDEARAAFPQLWDVTAEESEVRNPTQIKSTVSTYRKIYDLLKNEGFDGTILDASSCLGYGTRAGIDEYGFDVDDIEPYPDSSYEPKYTDYSKLHNTYDAIISNAVLNVIPQDQRDALVVKMGELLNPGGRMFINVRGNDVDTLANTKGNIKLGDREWIVTSTGSYQKGFTKPELKAYLEDALGPGYTVETTNKFGGVAAIVTKDEGVPIGENYKLPGFFSLANPVDVYGDPVSIDTTEVTNATQSELSDKLFYADGKAYYQTEDGQTVVIDNVSDDSPEAEYYKLLEAYDNANSTNPTATGPYPIPQATRNADNGYYNGESNASLRRGSEEVAEEYQEGTPGRLGSNGERNEAGGPQSAEQEGINYSLIGPDHYNKSGTPIFRNSKGDYNAYIYDDEGNVITTADAYPVGSFEHMLFKAYEAGDFDSMEKVINDMMDETDEEDLMKDLEYTRQIVAMNPVLSDTERKAIYDKLDELMKKYGEIRKPKKAKLKNPGYALPAKVSDEEKVMRHAYTEGANLEEDRTLLTDAIAKEVLQEAQLNYVPQSNAESIRLAEELYMKEGSFEAAAAYIKGLVNSNKRVSPQDIALGEMLIQNAAAMNDLEAFSELVADVTILGHEYGQVLQSFQILRKLTPGGQAYYMQKVVDRLNDQYRSRIENPNNPMKKITISDSDLMAVSAARTKGELDKAIADMKQHIADQIPPTWADKWNAWRYLAMLGNPRTHIRNIVGNAGFKPAIFLKDMYARGFEKMYIDEGARNRTFGADLSKNSPFMQEAETDWNAMKKIVAGEAGGNKYSDANEIQELRRIFNNGLLNKWAKLNSDRLGKEDLVFMKGYYKKAWAEFMQARGLSIEEVQKLGGTRKGRKLLQEDRVWAMNEAQRNTYHDANALASTINRLKRQNGVSFVLLEGLVPFTKTPANILKRAIEYSPYGLVSGAVQLRRDLAAGRSANEAIDRMSAGLSGTTILALGVFLRMIGWLRGAGLDDEKEEEFAKLQGHQQWAIEIGNVSYTIDWMAPTALPLFVGASAFELFNSLREDGSAAWSAWEIGELATRLIDPMLSLSMLDGIENTISSLSNAQGASKLSTLMTSMFLSYAAQGMPTIAGQAARSLDPSRRATYIDKNSTTPASLQRFWQSSVLSKIPFKEATKMAYVDEWGRTDTKENAGEWIWGAIENFFSPGYANIIKNTVVDEELNRLYEATGDKVVLPGTAAKYFNEIIDNQSVRKELTADEYETLAKTRGQTAYSVIADIIASAEYAEASDADRVKLIENAYTYADQAAKNSISEFYKTDNWVQLAKDIGAVDYILIKTDFEDNKSNERVFNWLATNPRLNEDQIATLIASKFSSPDEVKSASSTGYIYELTEADDDAMGELFGEMIGERLAELRSSETFKNADLTEQGALMKDLYTQTQADCKTLYGSILDGSGRAMTLGKASAVGKEAFHMVLDTKGSASEQADWIGKMYNADKSINNPLHKGYNLNLSDGDQRHLEQSFQNAWNREYQNLLNSDEFKNAPNRTYQENMIADRYNATATAVEDQFAAEMYRSGKYDESFGRPNSFSWGEAYSIVKGQYGSAKEQGEWLTQKYSTGTKIDNPDRPGYVMTLTGAQQAEIKEDFAKSFVPAYEKLVSSKDFKKLSAESQENRVNDLQKKVTKEVEQNYARKLIQRGGYSEDLDLNSSYEKIYTLLSTENVSKSTAKNILKDKYEGGTTTNPEAKEYRIKKYKEFIDANFDKYIKKGTAAEYEKLHTAAGKSSGDATIKKYSNTKYLGGIPDLKYDIPIDYVASTDTKYSTTYPTKETSTTQYTIPPANKSSGSKTYSKEQQKVMSKYGLVPNG